MGVSGEGAALRSARKWLLLLMCPEMPDRSGGKESLTVIVAKAAGYLGRSQWRHNSMVAYGAAGKQHGHMASLGHTSGETHNKGGSKGPFLT